MKKTKLLSALAGAMFFGGLVALWKTCGWQAAAGVFLVAWAHNIEKHL